MEVDLKFTYINEQSDPGGQAPFSSPHQAQARRPGCSFLFPRSKPPAWLSCELPGKGSGEGRNESRSSPPADPLRLQFLIN